MLIAKEKRRTNLPEYLLYMWQIEDIIRAYDFSIERINKELVEQYDQPAEVKKQIRDWYKQLINMMKEEGIEKQGHLRFLANTLSELNDFHLRLLSSPKESAYRELYKQAGPSIQALGSKVPGYKMNDLELCLNGLYGLLMLRLQKKHVSDETTESMQSVSRMLAYLADRFRKFEQGDYEL
jgi:4-hydroxyphenylpyruvate dioxygenase-like putative hemolysin